VVGHYLFVAPVLRGITVTLELTVIAMVAGVLIGILLAVMRLSPSRLLSGAAWVYIWFFRGTPVLVQLFFWYLGIAYLYQHLTLGVPFGPALLTFNSNTLITTFVAGALDSASTRVRTWPRSSGPASSRSTRASPRLPQPRNVQAPDAPQDHPPQAMRVIIPPTGNETISMLKTTSLVSTIAVVDLFQATQSIASTTYQVVPLLMVASLWYLFFTSIMTIGQYYVERYYAGAPPGSSRPHPSSGSVRRSVASPPFPFRPSPAPSDPPRGSDVTVPADTRPMVEARAVHKAYGRLEVLKGIDITVGRGEVLCLIGPSGSGKSTFLRCINHLEKIDGGELCVDGELVGYREVGNRLHELKDREVCAKRAEIGMVFQRFNLFPTCPCSTT